MASLKTIIPIVTLFVFLVAFSEGREFLVGGKENAWTSPPSSDSLILWAEKNRFIVGDFLIFEYNPNTDSVLQVTMEEYESCNKSNPIKEYKDPKAKVELDRPGRFYFISKAEGSCEKGQKLIVVVLSNGHHLPKHSSPLPAPESAPVTPAPAPAPQAPAPAPNSSGALRGGFIGGVVGILVSLVEMWFF
ncbi:hypothetical protein FH972_020820 [Carpinus fangiana]|uniref:Phytocyanin domain-containing protein n=1 Tax=Carpinus fangiana TaxID=176857 RepID=A0A5N6RXU7_9ROSI|nr:hypothetical protein FH972_020820 [Carpinus fangiana]